MYVLSRQDGAKQQSATPDSVERMMRKLSLAPTYHEIDRVLEHAGRVLDVMQAIYLDQVQSWQPKRRSIASQTIQLANDAVDSAIRALVIEDDTSVALTRMVEALPKMRRAWAWQTLAPVSVA